MKCRSCGELSQLRWFVAVAVNCRSCGELSQLQWIVAVEVICRSCGDLSQLRWIVAVAVICRSCGELPQLRVIAVGSCKLLRVSVAPAALPGIGSNSGVKWKSIKLNICFCQFSDAVFILFSNLQKPFEIYRFNEIMSFNSNCTILLSFQI